MIATQKFGKGVKWTAFMRKLLRTLNIPIITCFTKQKLQKNCVISVISHHNGHSPTRTNHYMAHSPHRLAIFIFSLCGKSFYSRPLPTDRSGVDLHHVIVARAHVGGWIFHFSRFSRF